MLAGFFAARPRGAGEDVCVFYRSRFTDCRRYNDRAADARFLCSIGQFEILRADHLCIGILGLHVSKYGAGQDKGKQNDESMCE